MPVRNKENEAKLKEITFMPSTLETIDRAFYGFIDDKLNIFTSTNKGWNKTPVLWVSAERAFQIKNNKQLRDSNGVLKLPIITIEKTSITKDSTMHGRLTAHIPDVDDPRGGTIVVARRIQQEKTSNFAAADSARMRGAKNAERVGNNQNYYPRKNKKIVYENISIPLPVYVNINYTVTLRAEYQQQINEMLTPFLTRTGQINNFFINHDGHKFEGFLPKDFAANNNVQDLGEDERMFETKIDVRVLGHLIGAGNNQEKPKVVIRENAVQIRFPKERVIVGDEHPDSSDNVKVGRKDRFYKEL
jgi:hypothetical protein